MLQAKSVVILLFGSNVEIDSIVGTTLENHVINDSQRVTCYCLPGGEVPSKRSMDTFGNKKCIHNIYNPLFFCL